MTQLLSDDVLDSFERGWTPTMVRELVGSYRAAKRAFELYHNRVERLARLVEKEKQINTELIEIDAVEIDIATGNRRRLRVDARGFREGLIYACRVLTGDEVLP